MTIDIGSILNNAAKKEVFGLLEVDRRVLRTRSRVMNLSNVANIWINMPSSRLVWWILAGVFLVAALPTLAIGAGIPLLLVAGFFVYMAVRTEKRYLIISTNDGTRSFFESKNVALLENAMEFLAEKINSADQSATNVFNFEKGKIERLEVQEATVNQTAETIVSGNRNTFVKGSSGVAIGEGNTVGTGNMSGSGHTYEDRSQVVAIDFGDLPAQVDHLASQMRDHPSIDPEMSRKVEEILTLMKSGARKPADKSRIAALGTELCTYLQSYPAAVQLFTQVTDVVTKAL